jgi:hypothetical protein
MRGLWQISVAVVPTLISGMFLGGLPHTPLVIYLTLWLPLLFALWLSIRAQRYESKEGGRVRVALASRRLFRHAERNYSF